MHHCHQQGVGGNSLLQYGGLNQAKLVYRQHREPKTLALQPTADLNYGWMFYCRRDDVIPSPAASQSDAVYRAFIEAAKALHRATPPGHPATLELDVLRPALLRIGDKLAFLLVRLPGPISPASPEEMALELARETALGERAPGHAEDVARAIWALSADR